MGQKIKGVVSYALRVLKIVCIVVIALGVPWLIKHDAKRSARTGPHLGIEEFADTTLTSIVTDNGVYTHRVALVVDAHIYKTILNQHIALLRKKGVCVGNWKATFVITMRRLQCLMVVHSIAL